MSQFLLQRPEFHASSAPALQSQSGVLPCGWFEGELSLPETPGKLWVFTACQDASKHMLFTLSVLRRGLTPTTTKLKCQTARAAWFSLSPNQEYQVLYENLVLEKIDGSIQMTIKHSTDQIPPWSPPIARSHSRATTSAALPLDEPPAERLGSCGLRTGPVSEVWLPPEKQRCSQTDLPM